MFDVIYAGATSACFELTNSAPYYAPEAYTVYLNGTAVRTGETNVFSLFGLRPDTDYEVAVEAAGETSRLTFHTRQERCALNVRDFGAVGNGETEDTAAIQRAILLLPRGGRLYFPAGKYLTGPIFLKSHMTLELAEDAVLLGSTDKSRYPVVPAMVDDLNGGECVRTGTFEGLARDMYAALITAEFTEDVTLVGPGLVDGNAQNGEWWRTFKQDPVARPRLIFFNRCKGMTVHGIQAANAASWQLHPYYSEGWLTTTWPFPPPRSAPIPTRWIPKAATM